MKQMGHIMVTRATTSGRTTTRSPAKTAAKTAAKTTAKTATRSAAAKPTPRATTTRKPGAASPVRSARAKAAGGAALRKKELIDEVTLRSGVKKKYAKPAVEAMIDILGEAIAEGRELNLQPLGKIKQQRSKDTATARVTVAKIRQNKSAPSALGAQDGPQDEKSHEAVADAVE